MRRLVSRVVVLFTVLGLLLLGLPVGASVSDGRWPDPFAAVASWFSSREASAAPAPQRLRPPTPAKPGRASTAAVKPGGTPKRLRELGWKRTRASKSFLMSDGTTQVELSQQPMHYRNGKGRWAEIDTGVVKGAGADAFVNSTNVFRSRFGKSSGRLAMFEHGQASIALGVVGEERKLTPRANGAAVTFPDVFGTADVRYRVSPEGLKEDIVLAGPDEVAEEYRFELRAKGLTAKRLANGAIGFFKGSKAKRPAFVMPAPYMYDDSAKNRLGQEGFSEEVTQTVSRDGGTTVVTIRPDQEWLTAKDRKFPVVIDPTITIAPDPAAAQDTLLSEGNPTGNYGTNSNLNVGRLSSTSAYRSLIKFDTSVIPANAAIRSADLNLHFASTFGSATDAVPISAFEVNVPWTEETATWALNADNFVNTHGYNRVVVDDTDALSTSSQGAWRDAFNTGATGGSWSYLASGTADDHFTWNFRVPGPGDYRVEAHYLPSSNRGTATYSISGDAGSASVQVDQTAGATSGQLTVLSWAHHFAPGATARVRLAPPVGRTASADSVQLTEYSKQTREPGQRDAWHSFAVGSLVQKWVDGGTNNGFLLKGTDDSTTGPNGGVFYNASEDVYGGETAYRPNLVVTYGEPGVALNPPAVVHASGPELSWSKYVDPTPDEEDNLVEYQIFRGCKALPGGDCASPVGDHFVPGDSRFELVGTVASDVRRWTDESAIPSTASEDAVYGYWVVARTVDDTHNGRDGRASSNAQVVKIPREGRIVRAFTGDIADTTLSSSQSTTVLGKPDGHDWLQVGNGHSTYGQERALLRFDLADPDSGIKPGLKVTDARLELSESTGEGSGTPTFDVHALTKPFVEAEASWAKANATTNWASPGGDHESAVLGSLTTTNTPKRLTFSSAALTGKVQSWVADSSVNHGILLKAGSTASQYLNIVSSESSDTLFRPRLVVEHLAKDDAQTYEANEIPQRWVPGTTITTPVRVTNTSNQTWPSNLQLSYRWTLPDSSEDITVSGDRNFVALGKALAPGESVRLDLPIRTPINSDSGAKRQAYDLYLDLWDGDSWFSATNPPSSNTTEPTQGCAVVTKGLLCVDRYVEDPRSNQLGLEKFASYTGEETGAGAQLLTNLYSGNAVWSYDAMSNPSIGPAAFVRLAYNSMDVSDSGTGYGMSVQPATLTRLGSRLSVPSGGSAANVMTFIDGDGTTHSYKVDEDTATKTTYVRPPGIPLELARDKTAVTDKQWVFTRPDGTRFFFSQATGLQTEVHDSSGRALTFRYDTSDRLTSVVDSSSRTVLTLGYDAAGLAWIRDISGRALKFTYNSTHQLVKLEDGGGFDTSTQTFADPTKVKAFTLGYTDTSVNGNAKLNLVKDPRGASTTVEYFPSTEASFYKNWPKQYTDRRGNATTFAYSDPDSSAAKDLVAEITDVNGSTPSVTTFRMDGYGRTISIKDANADAGGKADYTRLGWDTDHNVTRLEEPNGAVSTWRYDPVTGYPLKVRDAMAVENGKPGVELTYQKLAGPGTPTVLVSKTSVEGRESTFTYFDNGNLKSVTNGENETTSYTYNTTTGWTLATATDALGRETKYQDYDPTGYPKSIIDPLSKTTAFSYDIRGNVLQVTDAEQRVTTAQYDDFGRPVKITTEYDETRKRTTETTYDLNDNVTQEKAPNGALTAHVLDAADNVTETSLPDNNTTGRKIQYGYDVLNRLVKETAPKGVASAEADDFVTKYSYDRLGQVLKVETPFTDADGTTVTPATTYAYDNVGNVILEIDPEKNKSAATDHTRKITYDLNHRVAAVTDAAGYTTKAQYDADGLLTAEIDARGTKRTITYDNAGRRTAASVPHTAFGETQAVQRETRWEYDDAGNVVKEIRPDGKYTETVYNANNWPIQQSSAFDPADARYNKPAVTYLEYNDVGQVERQSEPTYAASGSYWTTFAYHPSGELKSSTDPWDITATFKYDELGGQIERTLKAAGDEATRTQTWGYWPDGSMSSRSDKAAQQPVTVVDNSDLWARSLTGTWSSVSGGGANTVGTGYRYHAAASGSTDTFTWEFAPDVTGNFDVYVSCPVRSTATTAASYTVNHASGSSAATVDQQACTSATPWQKLGNYEFAGGSKKSVVLKPSASGEVVADAVKLVATDEPASRAFTFNYDANGAQTEVLDTTPGVLVDRYKVNYDGLGRTSDVSELAGVSQKRRTDYTYDLNSNVLTVDATRQEDPGNLAASRFTAYTWDARNLVSAVESGPTSGSTDSWSYRFDALGQLYTLTKPNGNVTNVRYHEDGTARTIVERDGSDLVAQHILKYTANGDRSVESEKVRRSGAATHLYQRSEFAYTPTRKLASVDRTGEDQGKDETYGYDAAGNVTEQTIGSTTSTMTYDRNRLVKTVVGSTTSNHRYDVFGRSSTIDVGSTVVQRNSYDGWDRLIRQRSYNTDGSFKSLKSAKFDPFDRTSWQATQVGSGSPSKQTRFVYLGLSDQVAIEEQPDSAGVWKQSKAYTYGPGGQKLALVDSPVDGTTSKKHFYGFNAHGDVESLTDAASGETTATYRYTAYGTADETGTTGADAITGDPAADADVVNPYRFNAKRFDGATGTYDMGFRDYDPGLNRFLTRDMYNGALADMALGADPWNSNRYAYAAGNPITGIELDGHELCHQHCDIMYGGQDSDYVSDKERETYNISNELNGDAGLSSTDGTEYWAQKAKTGDPEAIKRQQTTGQPAFDLLDVVYDFSPLSTPEDIADCFGEGDILSCISVFFKPGKLLKHGDEIADSGKATTKHGDDAVERGAKACRVGANSFSGDTEVLMADGSTKPIAKVNLGDKVLATDPETGEQRVETVKRVFVHRDTVLDLEVDGEIITTTEDHPFWSVTDQRFEDAQDLAPGELVLSADGRTLRVSGLRLATSRPATAYNLEITNIHTYHVGDFGVLVHNTGGCTNITEGGLTHSFDRHAAQWFGGQPTKAAQIAEWRRLIERAAGSSTVVPWSSSGRLTNAHLARVDGKYFAAQFDRSTGDLVTAFAPNNAQLGGMLRLLGK